MASILQSLKVASITRPNRVDPVTIRRNKLITSIHEQIEAAREASQGKRLTVSRIKRVKNDETGAVMQQQRDALVREMWFKGNDGKTYVELRYGYKPLEIAKGKSVVEVGEMANLIPVFEKLREAILMGEFDLQLNENAGRFSAQLKAKRDAKKK